MEIVSPQSKCVLIDPRGIGAKLMSNTFCPEMVSVTLGGSFR